MPDDKPHPWQRLTDDQIDDIRARHAAGETRNAIARDLHIDPTYVGRIIRETRRPDHDR